MSILFQQDLGGTINMVNKKIVVIATIIAILIVGTIVGINIKSLQKTEYTFDDKVSDNENLVENNNDLENSIDNEETDPSENEKEQENEQENENTTTEGINEENVIDTNTTNKETTNNETTNKTSEEKAMNLAKTKWGKDDDSVYYYLEEQLSDNIYIISVRSKETTARLMDYQVNLETGEVSEY
jgi:glucan-binding YG repeat protein